MTDHKHLTISWSSLRAHENCRMSGHLGRKGMKNPVSDHRIFYGGSVVDRVQRNWLTSGAVPGAMQDMVAEVMVTEEQHMLDEGDGVVKWRHRNDKAELQAWCVDLVTRLEPLLRKHVLPFEFEVAKRFKVPVQIPFLTGEPTMIYLIGEMDLLVRHPDQRFVVWDLKGTNDNAYWRKVLGQLNFYDVVVDAGFGAPCKYTGLLQPMCDDRTPTFEFTDDDRAVMWGRINRMASEVWQKDFALKETSAGCSWCAVKHACPRFTPVSQGGTMSLLGGGLDDVVASPHTPE